MWEEEVANGCEVQRGEDGADEREQRGCGTKEVRGGGGQWVRGNAEKRMVSEMRKGGKKRGGGQL
jgi:hypothetical protein